MAKESNFIKNCKLLGNPDRTINKDFLYKHPFEINDIDKSITDSYSSLRTFISRLDLKNINQDYETLVSLAHLVYGWMPTIVVCKGNVPEKFWIQVFKYIEDFSQDEIEKKFLKETKEFICGLAGRRESDISDETKNEREEGSIVGTSKLLHFINPEKYAIYDSRIYKFISGNNSLSGSFNTVESYVMYLISLGQFKKSEDMKDIRKYVEKLFSLQPGSCSDFRILDLLFWIFGKQGISFEELVVEKKKYRGVAK